MFLTLLEIFLDAFYSIAYTAPMTADTRERIWLSLGRSLAEACRMTEAESQALDSSKIAQLIGLLPFIAGCQDADRTALSHLAVWVQAKRGFARSVYDHRLADDSDPLRRLAPIATFSGGDPAILEIGMARLALCMLESYRKDIEADQALGNYNPLASGAWDYPSMAGQLQLKAGIASQELDEILSAAEALSAWWES